MSIEAMKQALEALKTTDTQPGTKAWEREQKAADRLHEAILVAEKQGRNFCTRCGKPLGGSDHIHTCTPPAAQRQPLTDEQIDEIVVAELGLDADPDDMHNFARAIEAAHGIKEST